MIRIERRVLIAALLLTTSLALTPAHAQWITPALKACMAVRDGTARLACYDGEMRRISAPPAPPHASSPTVASSPPAAPAAAASPPAAPASAPTAPGVPASGPAPPPASSAAAQFGLPPDENRERRMPSRITARVASATRQPSGRYVVTLDNGEVWVQTDDQLGFAPHDGSSVSIKRGFLGSYWLRDKYYVVAVRRVR